MRGFTRGLPARRPARARPGRRTGRRRRTLVPRPGAESSATLPPWPSTMRLTRARPRPTPVSFVEKYGSKAMDVASGDIPTPVSETRTAMAGASGGPSSRTARERRPPPGMASKALRTRLRKQVLSSSGSATVAGRSGGASTSTSMAWSRALCCTRAAVSRTTAATSHGRGSSRAGWPEERKSPTRRLSRATSDFRVAIRDWNSPRRASSSGPRRVRTWSMVRLMELRGLRISWARAEAKRPIAVERSATRSRSSRTRLSPSRSTIWLNVRASAPSSSLPVAGTRAERSPEATRRAASVRACTGRETAEARTIDSSMPRAKTASVAATRLASAVWDSSEKSSRIRVMTT